MTHASLQFFGSDLVASYGEASSELDRFEVNIDSMRGEAPTVIGRSKDLLGAMKIGEAWWRLAVSAQKELDRIRVEIIDGLHGAKWSFDGEAPQRWRSAGFEGDV